MKRFALIGLAIMLLALLTPVGADAGLVSGEEVLVAYAAEALPLSLVAETAAPFAPSWAETYTMGVLSPGAMSEGIATVDGERPGGFDILKEPRYDGT